MIVTLRLKDGSDLEYDVEYIVIEEDEFNTFYGQGNLVIRGTKHEED